MPPVKYTTAAVVARTILDKEVVKHIDTCFTKKGMKTSMQKRNYAKRKSCQGDVVSHLQINAGDQEKEKSGEECQVSGQFPLLVCSL